MASPSGSDDETNFDLLFGHCLSGKSAIDSLALLAALLRDPAGESALEAFCSGDAEVQLEVAWGKFCSYGASELHKDRALTSNSRLALTD